MDKYIDAIVSIKNNYPPPQYSMLREGLDLAIGALEKQIPKEVIEESRMVLSQYSCPVCKRAVYGDIYCPSCGQKLDWTKCL